MKNIIMILLLLPLCTYSSIDTIKQETQPWHTWSGITCNPSKIFYPKTIGEVQDIINDALQHKTTVRFYGSGHSANGLVCTQNYLINTDAFNKVLNINQANNTVRVESGIKLKDLYKILAQHNLALPNQGFIKAQSIAGALATGTHGTGKTGTMADFIVSIELIDGRGNYQLISADSHPEWLEAARMHLGALGFVYAITLQCVPLFVLKHKRVMTTWDEIFNNFDDYYNNNDYFMVLAHPISSKALVYTWNSTQEPPTNNFFIHFAERLTMNAFTNHLLITAAQIAPDLFTSDVVDHILKAMEQKEYREYSYITLSPIDDPYEVTDYIEEEIAIPVQHFQTALKDIIALYHKYEKNDFELVGFMSCRFVKGSNKALLSPTYNQNSVYISLVTLNSFKQVIPFYQEYEQLMSKYTFARPHWGKFNSLDQAAVIAQWGSENIAKFNTVRKQLDPHNIFLNDYLRQRLTS